MLRICQLPISDDEGQKEDEELEKLNTATDNINRFEVELDDAKTEFKRLHAESVVRKKQSAHKLSNSIEAAKPYYESRIYSTQLAKETQQAASNYEKAKSIHSAAKEMVYLAEQGLGEKSTLDTACQEMLSHAASKVNQSQLEVTDARNSLKMCQLKTEVANNRVAKLQTQLKQAIKASSNNIKHNLSEWDKVIAADVIDMSPYYETLANYNGLLKAQKNRVNDLESKVADAKISYNEALKNLEKISEEIHKQREERKQHAYNFDFNQTKTKECRDFPCAIDSNEEYLEMPDKLSTQSSPIHQRTLDKHDFPHLIQDFDTVLTFPKKLPNGMPKSASASGSSNDILSQVQLRGPYDLASCDSGIHTTSGGGSGMMKNNYGASSSSACSGHPSDDNDIEQWTEIRLSHSDSTSSSYSNQSLLHDQTGASAGGLHEDQLSLHSTSSSSDEPKRKVTCTTIFHEDQANKKQRLGQWLSRSNSFKTDGRRQSLDLLIDAGDRVKNVFNFGFQKVGKTLERRNSESEMSLEETRCTSTGGVGGGGSTNLSSNTSAVDFFSFTRSVGTDDTVVANSSCSQATSTQTNNKHNYNGNMSTNKKINENTGLLGKLQEHFTKLI